MQNKVEEDVSLPPGCSLWFGWVLVSITGSLLGWFVGWQSSFMIPGELSTPVIGTFTGLILGLFQWLILRSRVRNAGWWVPATAAGWGAGFLLGVFAAQWFGLAGYPFGLLIGGITGAVLGILQWAALVHGGVRDATMWIPISVFAWTSALFYYQPGTSWVGALYGALAGIVTATALLWLLHRPAPD
ncbi:MAG: hypothetical protein GX495_14580 [Chloroflexi bacterium]|nr:hypothetical protein [Chloroflexota bacterium]